MTKVRPPPSPSAVPVELDILAYTYYVRSPCSLLWTQMCDFPTMQEDAHSDTKRARFKQPKLNKYIHEVREMNFAWKQDVTDAVMCYDVAKFKAL